jgi:hypothetical protein
LLEALQANRGRGRNDRPIRVLWFCAVLQRLLRHPTMRLTLEELRRNPDLRRLAGMEHSDDVPQPWNRSRFLAVLGREPFRGLLQNVFDRRVERLGASVPDLGRHGAGDATHLSARRRGCYPSGFAAPDGGRKEYTNDEGKVTEALEWFGYTLHVLCDTRHEVALAYDKACDDGQVHALLKEHAIRPVIQHRSLWKDKESRGLDGAGVGNVVYDEAGTLYGYDMVRDAPIRHRMAYIGHEPSRGTLTYRCPAEHESWRCPSSKRCNHGKRYGASRRLNSPGLCSPAGR